jgi:hypothetical protein
MKKYFEIFLNALPLILMILLIPVIKNDYLLTVIYIIGIIICFLIKREKGEIKILIFGFCIMLLSEYFFISTGVETFNRNSLFGLMPLWLPFLWSYGFVAIKRSVRLITL